MSASWTRRASFSNRDSLNQHRRYSMGKLNRPWSYQVRLWTSNHVPRERMGVITYACLLVACDVIITVTSRERSNATYHRQMDYLLAACFKLTTKKNIDITSLLWIVYTSHPWQVLSLHVMRRFHGMTSSLWTSMLINSGQHLPLPRHTSRIWHDCTVLRYSGMLSSSLSSM